MSASMFTIPVLGAAATLMLVAGCTTTNTNSVGSYGSATSRAQTSATACSILIGSDQRYAGVDRGQRRMLSISRGLATPSRKSGKTLPLWGHAANRPAPPGHPPQH